MDALSRAPVMMIEEKMMTVIKQLQINDERCKAIATILEKGPYKDYSIEGGLVKKLVNGKQVLFVRISMRTELVRTVHANGHFSVTKMFDVLKNDYYILKLAELAKEVVECCVPCILATTKRGKKEGKLCPIPKRDVPLATFHVDHVGPMDATTKLYRYLLVVLDGFTKLQNLLGYTQRKQQTQQKRLTE